MSGRIPQDFIDDLVQRADIVEVIGGRVPLTRAGREYKARCPFHNEKTPSFWVSPQKGFYHCFGCGAHGTALGFLMEYERLEFPAAVEELARSVGIEVPRAEGDQRESLEPLYAVLEQAAQLYRQSLRDHPVAVDYLKQRGLDGETARDFGIGFAPSGWDTVLAALGSTEEQRQKLLRAGLVIQRDTGGFYDRFRERIMFPIRDSRGRTIAFGGRIIGQGEPKYLNSPETPVFHKGRELYGLYEARRAERTLATLLVVEGYMDVVMLAAHGIRNVVGTLGTATTAEHLRRLFGVASDIVFCFDGDRAGREAAWRALQVSLPVLEDGRQIRFLLLPQGEDPDSLVRREGAVAFRARLTASAPLSAFLLDSLGEGVDTGTLDGKARLAALARPLLAQIPGQVYRELLTAELGHRLGLARNRVDELLGLPGARPPAANETAAVRGGAPARPPAGRRGQASPRGSLGRQAISLLMHYPAVAAEVSLPADLQHSGLRGMELLAELHALARTLAGRPAGVGPPALLERWRDRPEYPHLAGLLAEEPLVAEEGAAREFTDCLERLTSAALQQEMSLLLQKAGQGGVSPPERERLAELQRMLVSLGRRDGPAA
ncbi:MAG: DNA primase [Gammaproteobacteria bacterium]|nr:DNA primase [Gammaproteobacteria bacterium]